MFLYRGSQIPGSSSITSPSIQNQREILLRLLSIIDAQKRDIALADNNTAGCAPLKFEFHHGRRIPWAIPGYVFLFQGMQVPPCQEAAPIKVVPSDPEIADFRSGQEFHDVMLTFGRPGSFRGPTRALMGRSS